MQCGTVSAVLCDSVYIGIGVECVTVSSVVFMEGTDRQCSVARLVLHCVTVCILVLVFQCVTVSSVVLWKEQTDKLGCCECWHTAVVLIPNYGVSFAAPCF